MLVTLKTLLDEAKEKFYAVGAFEFWSLDSVRAILEAAEELDMPVILQASAVELNYMGWKNVERAVGYTADKSAARVALHLDHSMEIKWVKLAIESGFTGVMIDASHHEYKENADITREVVSLAKPYGVSVESELGRMAGLEGAVSVEEAEAFQTDPDDAARFAAETGIDALAVAVGTVHGFYKTTPKINVARIKAISEKADIPLVLHGGSGTPDDKVRDAIQAGICKVNVCTEFMDAFKKAYQKSDKPSVAGLFKPGYLAGKEVIINKIKLFGNK
ncbi:MAG: class II fructose-bisphosphate aldolase [Defluviitaleaceae bacterium]|nr:class II fructose-bisphosphate aldolase [Defluviitaleaceae bacterium]